MERSPRRQIGAAGTQFAIERGALMPRSVPEWRGKNDDAHIPDKVQLRILDRQRPAPGEPPICPDCTMPIRNGQTVHFDHKVPLADGGEHAESNLRAIHERPCHKLKTAREAMQRAEARSHQKRSFGIKKAKRPMPGSRASKFKRHMDGTVSRRP